MCIAVSCWSRTIVNCGAQSAYHKSYLEASSSAEGYLNDKIMKGPCGFASWAIQVLNSNGAMAQRQLGDLNLLPLKAGGGF
jgi:hypothetical protein